MTDSSEQSELTLEIAAALQEVKQIQEGKIQPLTLSDIEQETKFDQGIVISQET